MSAIGVNSGRPIVRRFSDSDMAKLAEVHGSDRAETDRKVDKTVKSLDALVRSDQKVDILIDDLTPRDKSDSSAKKVKLFSTDGSLVRISAVHNVLALASPGSAEGKTMTPQDDARKILVSTGELMQNNGVAYNLSGMTALSSSPKAKDDEETSGVSQTTARLQSIMEKYEFNS